MFCLKCGTENVEGARYCACCGAPLGHVENRVAAKQRQRFRHPFLLATVVTVILGCAYGVGLSLYLIF